MSNLPLVESEPFAPHAAASVVFESDDSLSLDDDTRNLTIEGEADDGTPMRLTYGLSQILVNVAEWDDPENATATTQPASTERVQAYGDDEDDDPYALTFDAPQGNGAKWVGDDPQAHLEIWDRAGMVEPQEDFVVATAIDDANPVGNEVDAYWVLINAEVKREGVWVPVWMHEKLQHDDAPRSIGNDRYLESLIQAYLDQLHLDTDEDHAGIMVREAELHQLVQADQMLDALGEMIADELQFRVEHTDKLAAGDDADRHYAALRWLETTE